MPDIQTEKIALSTRDGICPCHVYHPTGNGPWPAVLVYMDGIGIRPAMLEVGERLAGYGYFAMLPDLFYRTGPYAPKNARTVFVDPEQRKEHLEKFMPQLSAANIMSDTQAFLDYLDGRADVQRGGIATTGYCRGGNLSLTAAGTYPERIVACASYHGSRLANDQPDSPHLLAPRIKARVYIGGASEDATFPDDMKQRLEQALTAAGVEHTIETYPAHHGWVLSDTLAYNAEAAERHWQTLTALLAETLKRA
ncbi:MAG TPA: dienelactone hydrolase family protein [Gallionellaceae bacterium]|nr:dienelactone hydrolase family protein [Gallionellaceae bacterium]